MFYVEIELDGVITPKRCPQFKTKDGFVDYSRIRDHFAELGYKVGQHIRLC